MFNKYNKKTKFNDSLYIYEPIDIIHIKNLKLIAIYKQILCSSYNDI